VNIVAVVGPTATGKSDLAVEIAHALGGPQSAEIVNADAYQLYRGMDIGTAKVTIPERREIIHHQFDVLDVHEDSSVAAYQHHARADLAAIAARSRRAIVVGGSGLYVRALLDHMNFPGTDPQIRERLESRAREVGTRALYEQLEELDPAAAHAIGHRNERRIVRALEVIELTGQPYSANLPTQQYVTPTVTIGLDYDRAALDARVETRVERMMEQGLVDEVASLYEAGMGRTASRAVGYAEIIEHLEGTITLAEAQEQITANTRRLTRKQMGWFGRDPRIVWLNGAAPNRLEQALEVIARADQGLIEPTSHGPVRRSLGS